MTQAPVLVLPNFTNLLSFKHMHTGHSVGPLLVQEGHHSLTLAKSFALQKTLRPVFMNYIPLLPLFKSGDIIC